MNPKLCKRLVPSIPSVSVSSVADGEKAFALQKTSVRDQAALLLSIADIARSEIGSNGFSALWKDDEDLPCLPHLSRSQSQENACLNSTNSPNRRPEASPLKILVPPNRIRSVSIDSPGQTSPVPVTHPRRAASPLLLDGPVSNVVSPVSSPGSIRRLPLRKQTHRLSLKAAKHQFLCETRDDQPTLHITGSTAGIKTKSLQGDSPKGIPIKKILRRKFSWKNYPELEQFLIVNREEYLRHSALNYTVQQKQYNNRLTERLLELATEHGYIFEEKEFSFVTVRDRIRCYYKSFVQSAKKRGILMGYAARKAGLLNEDDLEQSVGRTGRILNA